MMLYDIVNSSCAIDIIISSKFYFQQNTTIKQLQKFMANIKK